MNRADIEALMQEAGLKAPARGDFIFIHWDQIATLLTHERELCAKVCDEAMIPNPTTSMFDAGASSALGLCAAAIRARTHRVYAQGTASRQIRQARSDD